MPATPPGSPARTETRELLDEHDLGVSTFLIRGYDPLDDGREPIPVVRAAVAERDRELAAA
jgi:alkanesulfonate monooxygenase